MLNICRCKFYKHVANVTTTRRMRLVCVYGIAGVSLFLIFASTCSISLFSFKFCLLSAFLFYSMRMLANLLIRIACSCLRICCEYAFLTEFMNMYLYSQYLLNSPNAYKYERMSGDELANIVICKRIRAIMVSPLFLGGLWSNPFDTCR